MIVRMWTTEVLPDRTAEYLAFARSRSSSMFLQQDGCLGVLFLRLPDDRHVACSFWRDAAAVDALSSSATYRETAAALAATGALRGQQTVVAYQLEGGALNLGAMLPSLSCGQVQVCGLP